MNKKHVLITGGTGGLGLATAQHLVSQGWHVFAADCNQDALDALENSEGITPVFLDVTSADSIKKAFDAINQCAAHLDGIVNFAGILRVGSMAEMDEKQLQLLLDINVMGTFRVNRQFWTMLQREGGEKGGRIINISSETGWQSGGPFNGAYAMSKHAIEAYSDSLRRELMFLNIPVIKVQPGPFKTDMVSSIETNFTQAADNSEHFKRQLNRIKSLAVKENDKANSPQVIADVVHEALTVPKPKPAYSVKADPSRSVLEYFPTRWADGLLKAVLKG